MKEKIVQVVGTMDRGGAETMLMDIMRKLCDKYEFHMIVNYKGSKIPQGDYDEEIKALGGKFHYIKSMWETGIKNYIDAFVGIINEIGDVHVVHSHLNSKGGVIAKAAYKANVKKILVHSHAVLEFEGSLPCKIKNNLELSIQKRFISKYATHNIACSSEAMNSLFYVSDIEKKKSFVLHNAIDISKFLNVEQNTIEKLKEEFQLNEKNIIIGTVGRLAKVKQYNFIVDVLAELKARDVDFEYLIVGAKQDQQYVEEIFEKIKQYNLEENVKYIGNRSDVECIYPLFDVFLGASIREGLGMVSIEAQAAGVPCVLSDGFPKSVDLGLNLVHFLKTDNVEKWCDSIINIKKNINSKEDILKQVTENGYNIDEEIVKIDKLYTMRKEENNG